MAETRAIRRLGRSPVRHVVIHSGASCVTVEGQVTRTVLSAPARAVAPAAAASAAVSVGAAAARENARAAAVLVPRAAAADDAGGELVERFILVRSRRNPHLN